MCCVTGPNFVLISMVFLWLVHVSCICYVVMACLVTNRTNNMGLIVFNTYCNDPIFSERKVLANSADPDQTAPRGAV